ncbi:MAG: DUF2920 family protein [bacterium]|nr:DUF2920 family protein [bacterium]
MVLMAVGILGLNAVLGASADAGWPALPEADGEVVIPAQEWPIVPGPRTVKVYVRYPGKSLANVTEETGLMISAHNWGNTAWSGTAHPEALAERFNVVAISLDYLQSGREWKEHPPYDFGYLQALDALRALYLVFNGLDELDKPFARGRIYCTGGSGGGNVTLMANKLAPRTFACSIDKCGMAELADDIAYGEPGRTHLNARYSRDPESPQYLSPDGQALRHVGNPDHLAVMKALGNETKLLVVHGVDDASCPFEDKKRMVDHMIAAGLDVEPHYITKADVDGEIVKSAGHSLGDRTRIVFKFADRYLLPDSSERLIRKGKTDFERRDEEVRYETANGAYVISYTNGYPVGRFEAR